MITVNSYKSGAEGRRRYLWAEKPNEECREKRRLGLTGRYPSGIRPNGIVGDKGKQKKSFSCIGGRVTTFGDWLISRSRRRSAQGGGGGGQRGLEPYSVEISNSIEIQAHCTDIISLCVEIGARLSRSFAVDIDFRPSITFL